ncbi:hypothetical protein AB6A40_003967 [Gnathostoma spinigerum]|uniref:GATOR2 complex protein WDR24 n=1 Tax=Gnathostoma spinigerum TaxID=75299 RepID=A0ABD6EB34_9BILA
MFLWIEKFSREIYYSLPFHFPRLLSDSLIASTSTNGAVVLWNVEKGVLDHNYKAHTRSATKVCFHRVDKNILISGAKDANVFQYDLRILEPVRSFASGSFDPIRDMEFGIHQNHTDIFVVADDGGSIRFWDLRRCDKPLRQFVAHHGPASIALNPDFEERNLIATAGRDKFIRIWQWSEIPEGNTNTAIYSVETTASVSRVYWRPQYKYQVASCSVVNDFNIYIWDIRRPFIPFACFENHKDICSDMSWKFGRSDAFISAGKDGLIIYHHFENAHHPLNHANDVALDMSPSGEIVIALSSQLKLKNDALAYNDRKMRGEIVGPKRRQYDPFQSWIDSRLIRCIPDSLENTLSPKYFIYFANNYKLYGDDLSSLCDHNSRVAENIGRIRIAYTWRMVGLLCSLSSFIERHTPNRVTSTSRMPISENDQMQSRFPSNRSPPVDGNGELEDVFGDIMPGKIPTSLAATADFYFGDDELNTSGLTPDCFTMESKEKFEGDLMSLKLEAFAPRPRDDVRSLEDSDSVITEECSSISDEQTEELSECELTVRVDLLRPPKWDPLPSILSMLMQHSENGDVQMCVSILLVLGEETSEIVDHSLQKLWFLDYLEMLDRYELWTTAANVIRLCWIPGISALSNESTFVRLVCLSCRAVSVTSSQFCKKCLRKFNFTCIICQLPVRDIWGGCQICRHGGHPSHLSEWFKHCNQCPSGCGHQCTYAR